MARASRIKVTSSLQKQLEDNINFDEINYFIKRDGEGESRFFPEWEKQVSEEKLISIKSKGLILDTSGNKNLVHFPRKHAVRIKPIIKSLFPDRNIRVSGFFYYPKTGYMGWHTNNNAASNTLYLTYSTGVSFFRYYDGEKVITDYDDYGFTIRTFELRDKKPYFWHCVGSDCDRFSFGFRLMNGYKEENLKTPLS